jgi:hypothetical protein
MVHSTEDWKISFPMTSQSMLPTSPLRPRYFIMRYSLRHRDDRCDQVMLKVGFTLENA